MRNVSKVFLVIGLVLVACVALAPIAATSNGFLVWETLLPTPQLPTSGAWAESGGRVFYIGGRNPATVKTVWEYRPSDESWGVVASSPRGHDSFATATAPDGRVFAIGGWDMSVGWLTSAVDAYDPVTNTWSTRAPLPVARQVPAAATATNGRIYAIGGTYYYPYVGLTTVDEYDPVSNVWTAKAPMPTGRWMLAAVGASNGKVYAIGGYDGRLANSLGSGIYDPAGILGTVEEYDPASDSWSTKAPMPTPRVGLTAVAMPDGRIYAIGGLFGVKGSDPGAILATVEVYDTATDTWTTDTPISTPRTYAGAVVVDDAIYVMGGNNAGGFLKVIERATPGVPADQTPPVTSASLSGVAGNNGWYRSSVTVNLAAADLQSAVASTAYRINGADWTPYVAPFVVSTEGITTVSFASTDAAGNVEPAVSIEAWIDTVAPTVSYAGNAGTYTAGDTIAITCDAVDGGSGVASSTCAGISGPASAYQPGAYTFSASATDSAGNVGSGSTTFTIQAVQTTIETLRQMVGQFVVNAGIANSLTGKLVRAEAAAARGDGRARAAMIRAFVNEVEAQSGKALTAAQAAQLIALVLTW